MGFRRVKSVPRYLSRWVRSPFRPLSLFERSVGVGVKWLHPCSSRRAVRRRTISAVQHNPGSFLQDFRYLSKPACTRRSYALLCGRPTIFSRYCVIPFLNPGSSSLDLSHSSHFLGPSWYSSSAGVCLILEFDDLAFVAQSL